MISRPFCISNGSANILGVWDQPDDFEKQIKKRICLICIGLNGNRIEKNRILIRLSRHLTACGISVIRFEYSGLGVSEGDFWASSIKTKILDTLRVIYAIKNLCHDNVDWDILSYSDGISVALDVLEQSEIHFNKLISWSPILIPITSEVKERMRFVREPRTQQLVVPFGGLWLGKKYLQDLSTDNNLLSRLMHFADRAYCIFGSQDWKVKNTVEKLCEIGYNNKIFIEGSDHEFGSKKWIDEVIKQTANWLMEGERI